MIIATAAAIAAIGLLIVEQYDEAVRRCSSSSFGWCCLPRERISACCNSARRSGATNVLASAPNPVETP